MRIARRSTADFVGQTVALALLCCSAAWAQRDSTKYVLPQASAARAYAHFDAGELAPETTLRRMRVLLSQDMAKRNALHGLLAAQHDQHSARYHQWLSAEEYGKRFGAEQADVERVTAWLGASGMKDIEVSPAKNFISFSASAETVETAMHVKLHAYRVQGETHYANTAPPVLPQEMRGRISSIQGLDDFVPRAPRHRMQKLRPQYIAGAGGAQSVGAGDLATIYDTNALYAAGIDGSHATIAVIGAAAPSLTDFHAYKTMFSLPANDYVTVVVPNGAAAASTSGAVTETALDLELAGAMAPKAKLLYVQDGDVLAAVAYVIDNNLAQVVSLSYTVCELPGPEDLAYETLALQGAAEGITWVNATGDSGAAACDQAGASAASDGLAVDLPASLPEVTGVGGTSFVSGSTGQYWAASNGAGGTTALGYVPETAWNAAADGLTVTAGGGGASKDFFKPGYQSSITDGVDAREVPDVVMDASEATAPYLIVTGGQNYYVGGTSAAAPVFAGIAALVNDYLVAHGAMTKAGLGGINAELYRLAQTEQQVFHDVTSGNNKVACATGSIDCAGGLLGYDAGNGYDMATGLGSVDAYKLAQAWESVGLGASSIAVSAGSVDGAGSVTLTATVKAEQNPSPGVVIFSWTNTAYLNVPTEFARVPVGDDGVAATTFAGMPNGANLVSAVFQGTTALLGSSSNAVAVTVARGGAPKAAVALLNAQAEVAAGLYLPLAATVTGTNAPPTGLVDFSFGGLSLGSAPVVAGIAQTLSSVLPPAGAGSLTAHYSGDATYAAADAAPFAMTVIAATGKSQTPKPAPDFTLTAPASATVTQGESANIALAVAPMNGFAAPIVFTCSGTVAGFGCAAPATMTPTGKTSVMVNLTAQAAAFLPLVTVLFFGRRRRIAVATGLLLMLGGCGYHANKAGEPVSKPASQSDAGTYSLTITATSGTLVHTAVVSVSVQ